MTDEQIGEPVSLQTAAEVAFVSELLAGLPRPAMPAEVSAPGGGSRRRVVSWLAAAAVVVVAAGVGIQVLNGSGQTGAATASSSENGQTLMSIADSVTKSLAAAGGGLATNPRNATPAPQASAAPSAPPRNPYSASAGSPLLIVPDTFAATATGLASCLTGLGLSNATPLLVMKQEFADGAAVALAVPGTVAGTSEMYVVGTDCSATQPHLLGRRTLQLTPTPAAS
jgi:hypothetical protein